MYKPKNVAIVGDARIGKSKFCDLARMDIGQFVAESYVPTIMTEIEGMVYASSPFPVPHRMGPVTYTETWLWDKSGRFQLHTLTQGQK